MNIMATLRQRTFVSFILGALLAGTAPGAEVSPQSWPHYAHMESALARYQALAADSALTSLPPLPAKSLTTGATYEGAMALHRLLVTLGDLAPSDPPSTNVLDAATIEALGNFQRRHGLEVDGTLGPATWRELTTPLSQRVHQLEASMARFRALPPNPWKRAIFINIPQYRLIGLRAIDEPEDQMLRMNVVVGRELERMRTPTFVEDMTHLIFRPYWEVPRSITVRELLPKIRARPAYLDDHNFEIVTPEGRTAAPTEANLDALAAGTYRLRQRPGPDNSLGAVKFMMPNHYNVYLHDTPSKDLFNRNRRAFSHGCVRVSDPQTLAGFILQDDPAWTPARIQEAMTGAPSQRVDLLEPVRVYIVYSTAVALANGEVLFFDDVYGLDGASG